MCLVWDTFVCYCGSVRVIIYRASRSAGRVRLPNVGMKRPVTWMKMSIGSYMSHVLYRLVLDRPRSGQLIPTMVDANGLMLK